MPYLNWISDDAIKLEVKRILDTASSGILSASDSFHKNVIDPFAVIFEMSGFGIDTVDQWEITEKSRKAQKTLSNAFGIFHQKVLGHVDGWQDLGTGKSADLLCEDKKVLAEVKNKFNTVKGSDQVKVYDHLDSLVMPIASRYKDYTAYYVEIIPKPKGGKSQVYNVPFTPSDNETKQPRPTNELIRKIDGKSFYELVTGEAHALESLYSELPQIIYDITGNKLKETEHAAILNYFKIAFN
ncbi:Eco47II family restriction endonuclease [Methylophilus sp.]|uniref:Eco47II family restriction endonuclease n=1 Tax=Methylophilus sp. TaxID=29541 RepID=UPI000D481925|nr:Eco47II family restriction endonuclease [Methylophilus sp.]PPD11481.1 MAG: restriction endonuclease [Methylophilus sp.]